MSEHYPRNERRSRILHVINSLAAGGAETMLARLVGSESSDFEHVVLPLLPGGGVTDRVRESGALLEPLGIGGVSSLATSPGRLALRLRAHRPEVVQGWLLQGNLAATMGTTLARLHVPVIWNVRWTLYDLETERRRTRALLRLSGLLAGHPSKIVFNSRLAVSQHARLGFPATHARVIPNGFDLQRFRPDGAARISVRAELGVPSGSVVVGMLARYHPMKDHETSLHAAARLIERGTNAIFVYAGSGVTDRNVRLTSVVRQLGLSDRVRLLGERQDVERIYASMDLYWMSSRAQGIAEGFPNVIAEAMACGVPCVATDVGETAWVIGETGRVVPGRDPRALGDNAAELLSNGPDELRRLGQDARTRIERNFSLESVVAAYQSLYREVLG